MLTRVVWCYWYTYTFVETISLDFYFWFSETKPQPSEYVNTIINNVHKLYHGCLRQFPQSSEEEAFERKLDFGFELERRPFQGKMDMRGGIRACSWPHDKFPFNVLYSIDSFWPLPCNQSLCQLISTATHSPTSILTIGDPCALLYCRSHEVSVQPFWF